MSEEPAKDEVAERAKARVGQVLKGKYRLDRVIGIGGMAVVYAATHRNQKRVAVKMLHLELSFAGTIRTRFLREGYVANTVDHPGALAVLDEDVAEDGAAFLVMELLQGKALDGISQAKGKLLPENVVLAVGDQLLDVLASAHAKAIVHRDIKPANLFVTKDGTLKVLDFGIARLRDAAAADATSTGMVLGTPAFMAPEQAYGRTAEIDGQSDVWASGATLFQLLTGRNVHGGGTSSEILIKAATSPAVPVASLRPDVSPRVAAIVDRALAFEKSARWPTAEAMRDEIRLVAREAFADVASGKAALAELLEEVGSSSVVPEPSVFVPPSGAASAPVLAPLAPTRADDAWHEAPAAADRPVAFAPTLVAPSAAVSSPTAATAAGGSTAVPVTRSAPPRAVTPNPLRSAFLGVGAAVGLAALVVTLLVANGRLHLGGQSHSAPTDSFASAPSAIAASPPSAAPPAPSATPMPPPTASEEPAIASASAAPAASVAPPSPPAAVAPAAKPDPAPRAPDPAHAPSAAPRPPRPAHAPKASDDDLFHP